jgi:hypothetical protein
MIVTNLSLRGPHIWRGIICAFENSSQYKAPAVWGRRGSRGRNFHHSHPSNTTYRMKAKLNTATVLKAVSLWW